MNPLGYCITKLRQYYIVRLAKRICRQHSIVIPYPLTFRDADVLYEIFFKRVYATAFPFYQNGTIIDTGAHKGYFSLFARRYAGKEATIFSVEPEPGNYRTLLKNIAVNKADTITARQCALSSTTDTAELYMSESVNHSLITTGKIHSYVKQSGSVVVATFSLKDFLKENGINEVAFLKMDCEGAEYDTLFAADQTTFNQISTIALEFHDIGDPQKNIHTLTRFLLDKGYRQVALRFEEIVFPLNMGIVTFTR